MPRLMHGSSLTLEQVDDANRALAEALTTTVAKLHLPPGLNLPAALAAALPQPSPGPLPIPLPHPIPGPIPLPHGPLPHPIPGPVPVPLPHVPLPIPFPPFPFFQLKNTGFMFPDLHGNAGNFLPESPATVAGLEQLAGTMIDNNASAPRDSGIPAIYTYFGQFIDHDVTFDVQSGDLTLDANRVPLPAGDVPSHVKNLRTSILDLDSVYGVGSLRSGDRFVLGNVTTSTPRPDGTSTFGNDVDLPREGASPDPIHDRAALLGDPRNDENLFISQLHVAFLRAHNALIDRGMSFANAKRALTQHYQWLVLHDFLPRIADPAVVHQVLNGNSWYKPGLLDVFMPLEFSAAAFRFGHSMIRATYDYNSIFNPASLQLLFTFTALSGNLGSFPSLPQNWIADWRRMVDGPLGTNFARRIDTLLVNPLQNLPDDPANLPPNPPLSPARAARARKLPERNLVRGYRLRLPTGQAIATKIGVTPLTPTQLEAAVPANQAAVLASTGFDTRTPLWFYVLAEAAHGGGGRLGLVGSTIVAETLIGLLRRSPSSILADTSWRPSLGTSGTFTLTDLLRLARTIA